MCDTGTRVNTTRTANQSPDSNHRARRTRLPTVAPGVSSCRRPARKRIHAHVHRHPTAHSIARRAVHSPCAGVDAPNISVHSGSELRGVVPVPVAADCNVADRVPCNPSRASMQRAMKKTREHPLVFHSSLRFCLTKSRGRISDFSGLARAVHQARSDTAASRARREMHAVPQSRGLHQRRELLSAHHRNEP